jgi:ribose 5-phosphate isomerase
LESTLRPDFTTDNGNKILNVKFNDSYTFKTAADILDNITGVIEHGIFIGDAKADILIIE